MMKIFSIFILVTLLFNFGACQATPTNNIIGNKNKTLDSLIMQNGNSTQDPTLETKFTLTKEYNSGNKLIIDSPVTKTNTGNTPVYSIKENPFSESFAKNIAELLCPNSDIREQSSQLTKSDIEEEIEDLKKVLNDNDDSEVGIELFDPSLANQTSIEQIKSRIADLEKMYLSAPSDTDLPVATYSFRNIDSSKQINLRVLENSQKKFNMDFVNWEVGSSFYFYDYNYISPQFSNTVSDPNSFANDIIFATDKPVVDKLISDLGIDYMKLVSVQKTGDCYQYKYCRYMDDMYETYAPQYLGSVKLNDDGMIVMDLWNYEHLAIEVQGHQIKRIEWKNPSELVKTDNDNVKTLPWEQIKNSFLTQMDYILTPTPIAKTESSNGSIFSEPTIIYITRIEYGFTKILMQNSGGEYKLIPTWSFFGYDEVNNKNTESDSEICFMTINALDGSSINRGLMY